ncbi:hypothetical protein CRUP_002156 [Coryphaenoides rupestris]|nr:hypothetical protein CRUP_002156 [Coryphaenoides rupestris]
MSKKRPEKTKDKSEKAIAAVEEHPVITDDYQCSGNLHADLQELCRLLALKEIPVVTTTTTTTTTTRPPPPASLSPATDGDSIGWKVDVLVARVLCKLLPSLSNLQTVQNNCIGEEGARLIGSALSTTTSANRNLMCLNLAFNSIGDAGAAHIAQGLRLNRALLCLCLSHNKIGDTGAAHLAKVLGRFALTHEEIVQRRRLLMDREQSLSSESSPVESSLAAPSSSSLNTNKAMSSVRRKEISKKDEKPAVTKKDDSKSPKKSSGPKVHRGKAGKPGAKDKSPSVCDPEDKPSGAVNEVEPLESPLLETSVQHRDGQVLLSGNTALASLNLSWNQISEQPLPLFLTSLRMQTEGGGLLRLCLQRNRFCPDCEDHVKIRELMTLRDPLNKTTASPPEQEGLGD